MCPGMVPECHVFVTKLCDLSSICHLSFLTRSSSNVELIVPKANYSKVEDNCSEPLSFTFDIRKRGM